MKSMINLFISEVTRTTLNTGEGFELDQHLTDLREPDLDTLLLFDDKELETEIKVELLIAKGIPQTNVFGDLCIKESNQSCENKGEQHVVESKAAIDPLVIVKRDSDGHSGLGLAGTLRYGQPMLNRVTLQKVSLSLDAKVVHALLNTMPMVADLDKAFMGQLSNLRRREHHPVTQVSAEVTLAPPLHQRERSHGVVATAGNAEPNVTSRFGMPQVTRSIDLREMSNSSVAKIGITEPGVTSHSKERTTLPEFKSLDDRDRSSIAKTGPIVLDEIWRTRAVMAPPEPRYSKEQGLNNSFSGKAVPTMSDVPNRTGTLSLPFTPSGRHTFGLELSGRVTSQSSTLVQRGAVSSELVNQVALTTVISEEGKASHDIFHREVVKTNTDRGGLTVPSSLALQTLVPVERTTRTHFELAPEMFWQYPLVNSYLVLFRNKYYLFEFEEHQVTSFLEDVYDRT
ncbi:hypothetical protein A142_02455 [Vibrio splendidus 12E03]|uniref:Uncharacterized protein n=2 Tax=Vibrio splendidus TaxID=29497 RepID=A0A1E5FYH3_VIBSP|nr:hypothetical protein A142_02455 [Vibrio splendidus 12E03]